MGSAAEVTTAELRGNSVLITGAGGYIGQQLQRALLLRCVQAAYVYHEPTDKHHMHYGTNSMSAWCNLEAPAAAHRVLSDASRTMPYAKTVVHLAGKATIRLAADAPGYTRPCADVCGIVANYRNNVLTTANVLESAIELGYEHIIFASSQSVYGWNAATGITTEDTPVDPIEYYAASKVACEDMLRAASKHIWITVLRISGVFGREPAGLVYNMVDQALCHDQINVNFAFPIPIDVVHIDDVVSAIELAAQHKAPGYRVYNVSSGEPCSPRIIAERIAMMRSHVRIIETGVPCPIVHISNERARTELGWAPERLNTRLHQEGA